ncbi:MAG: hypothetical protein LBT50_08450 [Prevotellaceae bacterium]|jgi:hypothetical protein|nr:hypothetical protein [Prevotellaceae bacterium]
MKKNLVLLLFVILAASDAFSQAVLWQIGQKDKSSGEFALGPFDYRQYSEKFGERPVVYEIGKNNPKTDFPFVLPGSHDAWAGSRSKQIIIRFGIKNIPSANAAKLELNYVETHSYSPPLLEIIVNGHRVEKRTPAGNDHLYFENRKANPANLSTVIEIPANILKKGNNIVTITSKTGSWVVFDNIVMTTDDKLEVDKPSAGIDILGYEVKPGLIYGKNKELRQAVVFQVANWKKPQTASIIIDGKNSEQIKLATGINTIETSVPEVKKETNVTIGLSVESKIAGEMTVKAFPVRNWTVYLVQHTHTDIGYTKPQTEILAEHIRYIDYAIEYCELTENYPDDAKFRWTCEAAWAVREYLQYRPKEQITKFLRYVKNGQIEVAGMFFNMSEIVDENSFKTFLEPVREFKKAGIPVVTAMQNDVNGIAWCLADYMPDLGIKYFSMGENSHRALIPFDRPTLYKWESPSGNSVYSYRSDHYMTGNFWGIERLDYEAMAPNVFNYLETLEQKGYPFDAVAVQYSGYFTDNSPPSMRECEVIRDWNNKYAVPKLRSALFHEFMDYVTAKYDDKLPVFRAAYPDWWTDGFGSAARETAASRKTHSDMIAIQGLLAMAVMKGQQLPSLIFDKIRHIHENLLFYDEHTYGAAESISDPNCENSQVQWAEKASYAWEALKNAQIMYETSAGLLQAYIPRNEFPSVTFYNTLNWKRSGMVELYIDHEIIPRDRIFKIVDENGKELKTQPLRSRSEGTYYAIYAEDIPPMGYTTYRIMVEKDNRKTQSDISFDGYKIENEYFKISFDTLTGSIKSLVDKSLQLEMIDAASPWQLGAFVYETLGNRRQMERYTLTDYERKGLTDITIAPGTNGAIYQSVYIQGKSNCCEAGFGVKIEIRLFHHEKRIELNYAVKKSPITEPDGIYVAFPFKLANAGLYFDVQGGVVNSGKNQIEGTASDWNTVQNFVAARNENAQFVVGSNLIPLFQLGGINTGKYQRKKSYEYPHVYSWVTNNYWTTNFRAMQEGELRWNYYLTSSADVSNTFATRFGWSSRIPIYARATPKGKPNQLPSSFSSFRFNADNFLTTSVTPSVDKDYVLINVRELDGKATSFQILDATGKPLEFSVVNAIEEPMETVVKEVDFLPFGNKFVKLKLIN